MSLLLLLGGKEASSGIGLAMRSGGITLPRPPESVEGNAWVAIVTLYGDPPIFGEANLPERLSVVQAEGPAGRLGIFVGKDDGVSDFTVAFPGERLCQGLLLSYPGTTRFHEVKATLSTSASTTIPVPSLETREVNERVIAVGLESGWFEATPAEGMTELADSEDAAGHEGLHVADQVLPYVGGTGSRDFTLDSPAWSVGALITLREKGPQGLLFDGKRVSDFKVEGVGEMTEVADPLGSRTVLALTTPDSSGEEDPPRVQGLSPSLIEDGDEMWVRTKVFVPEDYPERDDGWVAFWSIYGPPFAESSPTNLKLTEDWRLVWQRNTTYDFDIPYLGPSLKGKWTDILVHLLSSKEGFFEMWVDDEPVTFDFAEYNPNEETPTTKLEMATRDLANNGGPNHAKILNYHQAGIFDGDSTTIYFSWLRVGTSRSSVEAPPDDPTAFKPRRLPPLELDVEVETPDDVYRLPCDSRIASKRPRAIRSSTQRGDGFGPAGCSFSRPIFKDYPDISPLDTWRFVGRNGDIAHESRLKARPSSNDPSQQVDIDLLGWMTYLTGRKMAALIIDRRSSGWGGPSMARQARILELGRTLAGSVDTGFRDTGSLAAGLAFTINRLSTSYVPTGEAWFYAGGEAIGKLLYDYKQISKWSSPDTEWTNSAHLCETDTAAEGVDNGTNHQRVDAASQILSASDSKKLYALIQNRRAATLAGDYANVDGWLNLGVVGDHDLTLRGEGAEAGIWLSDIIVYILQRFYPKIDTSGIQTNNYPVKQATWHDARTDGYQAIHELNGLAGWETNIWENRKFHYHAADLSKYDWVIDTTDPGVRVTFDGPSIEHFANGIEVTHTDFAGVRHVLYPADHPELRDDDDSNPANRHNEALYTDTEVPWPCETEEALQYARAKLAEYNRPKRPGRYRIQGGYIRDGAGHWHQGWKPRNSQTLGILNHPDDRPRLIGNTNWDQETKTLEISVDGAPPPLDVMVARQQRAREAANL